MSNNLPLYSVVVPKSQHKKERKKTDSKDRQRLEFDPLNFNNGGNFNTEEKLRSRNRDERRNELGRSKRKVDPNEGKVEAYLRQNQVNMRQQQHRHSAVRQAEHRVNLRSLPLNDIPQRETKDRTPTERYRGFPGEKESKDRRERDRDRERERDRERDNNEFDANNLVSPRTERAVRKSSSAHRVSEPAICADKRRFYCREWAFQKIAHCLEQRPLTKTCGALILGDAGSGKTALCQELSEPGPGPQARQQRALNRRLLARHFLQSHTDRSLRPSEFIRSLAMQILSHSSKRIKNNHSDSKDERDESIERTNSDDEKLLERFRDLGNDNEEREGESKPLLADSEDQRTDEEESSGTGRRTRTIDRIHEREAYRDSLLDNSATGAHLPEILPRASVKPTNPFLTDEKDNPDFRLYENHENVFLRNMSQRQSKENRTSRMSRQSSEPLSEKKEKSSLQKTHSIDQKDSYAERPENKIERSDKIENSPPKSRIPVASFRYPNKSDLKVSSAENSPQKTKPENEKSELVIENNAVAETVIEEAVIEETVTDSKIVETNENADLTQELPEYQNVLKPNDKLEDSKFILDKLLEKKRSQNDDVPPPIPSLPVSPRTIIANAYYDKLLSEPEIQQALLPHNLEKNPDECFKKALLFPLLEIDPPKQCLFLLVDAIDEGLSNGGVGGVGTEGWSVGGLLARHQHLLPGWLLLVGTARRSCRLLTTTFTGFRKITLDDLQRGHVAADVQRYVLARLDCEPRLRGRVSSDSTAAAAAAAALDHLRIKSDGCLLYLEKVLDGVADGFIALREIKEIPGTLNGLYLWLAQRLFHGRRFTKVRLLLDVLLAARCGVTEQMLYKCLLTKEYSVTREDFNRRLHLLRRILVMERSTGYLAIFHHSFAKWVVDVKHCTRRYLCCPLEGHAALAMYYTLTATRLSALEVHNYVYHMTNLEQHLSALKKKNNEQKDQVLDLHTIVLLWLLDSGCDIESALKKENDAIRIIEEDALKNDIKKEKGEESDSETRDSGVCATIESIMPELSIEESRWTRDTRVLCTLLELKRLTRESEGQPHIAEQQEKEVIEEMTAENPEDSIVLDPSMVFDLAARGEDELLSLLIKRHPSVISSVDAGGGTALHFAARGGKAGAAAVLLKAGADCDAPDNDGWSPLRSAAWAGHSEVVEILLEYGCDVDCVDADNRTALRGAAWSGHSSVVRLLLSNGASPHKQDKEGRTALIAACYMGHADIARALLDAGADIHHADLDGRTALSVASLCSAGAECVALLLERGADVSRPDRDSATPLLVAAFEGHTEICELLLEAEAEVEASDSFGRTALWAACSAGHAAAARLLLYWGAGVDHCDRDGRTVLTVAAAQGNVEVVRQLLDRGLDEHHRDNSGWTPLHYAAFEGHMEVCEALLEAGAKVDEADNEGKGALMLASQEGHTALVEALADQWGGSVHQRAHDGKTALRLAALEGHFSVVSALVSRGACVDEVDADCRSTLYVLALDNRLAMARYLLAVAGASCHIADTEGRTPLHVSAWQGHTDMVNLLVKVGGADIEARDVSARTALHASAWRGRAPALAALLALGAHTRATCTQGATPLGIAAQEGHEECVLLLLQHGADPLQADHCGRTPAKVAWRAGHAEICRLLERWSVASAPPLVAPLAANLLDDDHRTNSPELKRRSVHSSNSTKSSLGSAGRDPHPHNPTPHQDKPNRANLSLSFTQQVAQVGVGRRERNREKCIPENDVLENDPKLRSYIANERDAFLRGYAGDRDRRRDERHGYQGYERDNMSPLYASPPRSPLSDVGTPTAACLPAVAVQPAPTDTHFNRDTHMRIILGRDTKAQEKSESKNKRNGIVTNPAMRLVANVRNGLDSAAANIRRTGVALAASASSNNPAVKTNAFQWRKETPL